jgi:hypothetical protein
MSFLERRVGVGSARWRVGVAVSGQPDSCLASRRCARGWPTLAGEIGAGLDSGR